MMTRVGRAAEKLQDAAGEMARVATVVEATSQPMARRDPLRKHMDLIYKEVSHATKPILHFSGSAFKTDLSSVAEDAGLDCGVVPLKQILDAYSVKLMTGILCIKPSLYQAFPATREMCNAQSPSELR